MVTNRRVVAETDNDYYRTPEWATRALLAKEVFEATILEPCCGSGDISRVLRAAGYPVYSYDLVDRGYGHETRDAFTERRRVSNVVTNPPYNLVNPLVEHWMRHVVKHKLCLLLRIAFLEGASRYARLFTRFPPARIWVFTERVSMFPGTSDRTTGGTTCFAWFVWQKGHTGPPTIGWIEPGWKPVRVRTDRHRVRGHARVSAPRRRDVAGPTAAHAKPRRTTPRAVSGA